MLTAVAYARFSSANQSESSIEAQQDAIRRYASARHIAILEDYADRAKSGTNDKRPEFQRMLADLKARPVSYVLVHKVDRFARNRYDAAVYARLIADRGARLIAVAQDFGDGPEAVILEGLMQAMAEYYSRNLSTEVIKGRRIGAMKGRLVGNYAPFGYRHAEGQIVIVEEEAYFVRRFYEAAAAGRPFAPIVRELTAAGIRGRRGAAFSTQVISRMLPRPFYAGDFVANVAGETFTHKDHHPAIVSRALFEEANAMLAKKLSVGQREKSAVYICSGLAVCGRCGARLHGANHKGIYYYECGSRCGLSFVRADDLDAAACAYVAKILTPEVRQELAAALIQYQAGQKKASERRAPRQRQEIRALQKEIDALVANMAAGVLPPSVLSRLSAQIEEKEKRIEVLRAVSAPQPSFDPAAIDAYFANVSAPSPQDDPIATKKTLRRFIERITVHPDRYEFTSTLDTWLRAHHPELLPPSPDDDPDPDTPPSGPGSPPPGSTPPASGSPSPSSTTPPKSSGNPPSTDVKLIIPELFSRYVVPRAIYKRGRYPKRINW